jgi:DNA-binding transcriptional LysR family regulator
MAINLHHLRLFAAVVQEGGFTRAAAKLHLSQPAISKSLNELERQLDVNLLDRTGRSIRLTAAGRTLYERARELFGVESAAERELRELRGLKRGRCGSPPAPRSRPTCPALPRSLSPPASNVRIQSDQREHGDRFFACFGIRRRRALVEVPSRTSA